MAAEGTCGDRELLLSWDKNLLWLKLKTTVSTSWKETEGEQGCHAQEGASWCVPKTNIIGAGWDGVGHLLGKDPGLGCILSVTEAWGHFFSSSPYTEFGTVCWDGFLWHLCWEIPEKALTIPSRATMEVGPRDSAT